MSPCHACRSTRSLWRGLPFVLALAAGASSAKVHAQAAPSPPAPSSAGGVTISGSLRTRVEWWDWFGGNPYGTYIYAGALVRAGLSQNRPRHDWNVELSAPVLLALPEQPAGASPAGQGASYFVANDRSRNVAGLFVKQAFVRFKDVGGVAGQSLRIGRFEFHDGLETVGKDATLVALKRDRVASRLLANFGFSHVQRSYDGVQYVFDRPALNVTLLASRPTQGVFQADGWKDLDIGVVYGALTRPVAHRAGAAEWRLFSLAYNDRRSVTKADNRPLAARQLDQDHVTLGTVGGHYIAAIERSKGTFDLLLWGAAQAGSWGVLAHRAGAFAVEGGFQPRLPLAPWIRAGLDFGSGDGDPNDTTHGTFFQVLPTPRIYARFPFFNLMNSVDRFGEVILKPSPRIVSRMDVHSIRLAEGTDLWYQGGGAYQPSTFGFVGLAAGGHRDLATLYDLSADVTVTNRIGVGAYYAHASGGAVTSIAYPARHTATFGYVELLIRF